MHTRYAALPKIYEPSSMQKCSTIESALAEEFHTSKQCKKKPADAISKFLAGIHHTYQKRARPAYVYHSPDAILYSEPCPFWKIVRERHTCIRVPPRAGPGRRCCGL